MSYRRVTFLQFQHQEQLRTGGTGALTALLADIRTACQMISYEVNRGAMAGNLGLAGTRNVQDEAQKKLDVLANDIFMHVTAQSGNYAGLASEELDDIQPVRGASGRYLLLFDPIDGSSNIDVNTSVGSIFSILRLPDGMSASSVEAFLQPGVKQVCAGYALYGASTVLVLTSGQGVNGFTLDQNVGLFVLTHPDMRIPEDSNEFAINASRARFWEPPVRRYVDECLAGRDGPRGKDFNMRWVAAMVAEAQRILCRGGVFLYPVDSQTQAKGGRLRLMYEANPIAFIIEQAGGLASTGRQRILEVQPRQLHDRVGVIFGSRNEVERLVAYHREHDDGVRASPPASA